MVAVTSWGRLSHEQHDVRVLHEREALAAQLRTGTPGLAYGMGRSYGDVCLNPGGTLWRTSALDRFIHLDEATGLLECEAGVTLREIQRMGLPRGWMLPVTPGTQMVTVGGAIANDVHGKNHHVVGSFGDHVRRLTLLRTDGSSIECSPDLLPDWFAATVGGIGLTGVIVRATLQLRASSGPWLASDTVPYGDLAEFFALSDASEADWEHTVSWIDCLSPKGRGLFMRANPVAAGRSGHATKGPRTMPVVPPVSLVNRLSLRPFNNAYYELTRRAPSPRLVEYEKFFYPLDNLLEWNRMYGPRGFFQYQSVVPRAVGRDAVKSMLDAIAASGQGSFLAVLKTFGERTAPGMMSFPQPGVTLALDFPNLGAATLVLLDRLDAIVREARGRIYMAKDARMPRDLFEAGYPRLNEFLQYRDPGISSAMSRRLIGS